jgi:hypothetical protein
VLTAGSSEEPCLRRIGGLSDSFVTSWMWAALTSGSSTFAPPQINEGKTPSMEAGPSWKQVFERAYGADEKGALTAAASRWGLATPRLPSLADGRVELERIAQ